MLAKVTLSTPAATSRYLLAPERLLVLGRGAHCDIAIHETSVSRAHCTVALLGEELCVTDLGAQHGVSHRGQRVQQCKLAAGDRARIGAAEIVFDELIPPAVLAAEAEELAAKGCVELADEPVAPAAAAPATGPSRSSSPAPAAGAPRAPRAPTTAADDGEAWLGRTLGAYRITGVLGSGGSATVYRAVQVQLAREVALKVLRQPAEGADANAVTAFLREARAAAALADPRLVQVFDLGQDAGRHFLSMEYVRGGSLAARIRRDGPLSWRELLPILVDVAGALQLAHRAGLVHRDVKPANILLSDDGRAKLADLGLVRDLGGAGDRTGTAAFMAPEQLDDEKSVDGRADLYGLGCTAYAALAGRPPFVGTVKEILRSKRTQAPPPFDASRGVPPGVDRLVRQQLLAFAAAERPADAHEVLAELERLEDTGGGLAVPRRSRSRRVVRSGGSSAGMWVALVAGLVLLAVAYAIWQRRAG